MENFICKSGYCYRELESEFVDFSCDNCPEKLFLTDEDIKQINKEMENKNE